MCVSLCQFKCPHLRVHDANGGLVAHVSFITNRRCRIKTQHSLMGILNVQDWKSKKNQSLYDSQLNINYYNRWVKNNYTSLTDRKHTKCCGIAPSNV